MDSRFGKGLQIKLALAATGGGVLHFQGAHVGLTEMLLGQGEGPSAPPAATASPCAAPALPTDGRGAPLLVLSTVGQGYEEEKKPVAVVGAEKGIKVDEPLAQGQRGQWWAEDYKNGLYRACSVLPTLAERQPLTDLQAGYGVPVLLGHPMNRDSRPWEPKLGPQGCRWSISVAVRRILMSHWG